MPGGLVTNNFGWRGYDIDLNKPPHTIRLCFLGASTTIGLHSLRCSYPEYIGAWLNIWSQKNKWNIKFEIINAAREGVRSSDIAAIFRQEVLPLEPDFAIYYEGANQFEYRSLIKNLDSIPSPAQYENQGFLYPLTALEGYSATARRVSELFLKITRTGYGKEPLKPGYVLNTSGGIDTDEPDVSRPDLALNLSAVLRDLQSIHQQAHKINCQFYQERVSETGLHPVHVVACPFGRLLVLGVYGRQLSPAAARAKRVRLVDSFPLISGWARHERRVVGPEAKQASTGNSHDNPQKWKSLSTYKHFRT